MVGTILLVDPDLGDTDILRHLLHKKGHGVLVAHSGRKAMAFLKRVVPDVIVMNTMLPDITGLLLCKGIKARERTSRVPVIFLAQSGDPKDKIAGFDHGCLDYVTKPYSFEELEARVQRAIGIKKNEDLLTDKASRDPLTGVLNRGYLIDQMNRDLNDSRARWKHYATIMLDIDHFKSVNDTFGHPVGDEVLCQVSNIIKRAIRRSDVVGRYGGEEFVVSLPDASLVTAIAVANRIRHAIERTVIRIDKGVVPVTASLGLAVRMYEKDAMPLVERSDRALYHAKKEGRNCVAYEERGELFLVKKV